MGWWGRSRPVGARRASSTIVISPRPTLSTFVDTSALYAVLDRSDGEHRAAALAFLVLREASPVTHNYVLVESVALTQARLGLPAVRRLLDDLLPAITVEWVGLELHARAAAGLLASERRSVSFVDRVSFAFMRERSLTCVFAFDDDFAREGFTSFAAG